MSGSEIWTVVAGLRVAEIELKTDDQSCSVGLSVRVDGVERWSSEEPGWRDIACGVDESLFVWSARRLVIVPLTPGFDDGVYTVDCEEDILVVFRIEERWLLVCESSLKVVAGSAELSRLELPEVVSDVRWINGRLSVCCDDGSKIKFAVVGDNLEMVLDE